MMGRNPSAAAPVAGRLPFGVDPARCPAATGAEIVAVFASLAGRADKVQWVERLTLQPLADAARSDPAMQASARAGREIAAAIDAEAARADRNAYHNRQHFCEVMLVASFLGRWHGLPPCEAQRLLLAALIHDLDHDGRRGGDFRAERASLARAEPLLAAAGVDASERRRLAVLVLATEPQQGTCSALAAAAGAARPAPALAPELDDLARDAALARLAVLLCEADLLPSAGLTPDHAQTAQQRLAQEWQRPLGRDDKRRFVDRLLADGIVGDFFAPNVRALRDALAADTDDDGPQAG